MAGKYDDILAALPPLATQTPAVGAPSNRGKYDDILAGIPPPERSFMDKAKLAYKMSQVVPDVAPSPTQRIQRGLDVAGEKVAEGLGQRGFPKTGAFYGTQVSMIPDILGAATSLGVLETSQAPVAQAIRNTPRMLSPRYDTLNEAAGISKNLPERVGRAARFPKTEIDPITPSSTPVPKSYPGETNALLNFIRARIEGLGAKLTPQELNDYKTMINTAIRKRKIVPGTQEFAVATKLVSEKVTPMLNKAVPERGELDQIYAISKRLRVAPEIAKKLWAYLGPKLRYGVIGVP